MLSGWGTHGKLACPHCMEHSKAFRLHHGGGEILGLIRIIDFYQMIMHLGGTRMRSRRGKLSIFFFIDKLI